jgi:hypothetical protein
MLDMTPESIHEVVQYQIKMNLKAHKMMTDWNLEQVQTVEKAVTDAMSNTRQAWKRSQDHFAATQQTISDEISKKAETTAK